MTGRIKIDQIRQMQEKVYEKPIISSKKIYIIDNAETMTIEAQNCLLKTLEEPPEYIVIILITSNDSEILNTIKSRCMKISFSAIDNDVLEKFLKQECDYGDIKSSQLKLFQGSIGKAINIKNKLEVYEDVDNLLNNIEGASLIDLLNSQVLYKKEDINSILEYCNIYFMEKIKSDINNSEKYLNSIKIVENTKEKLKYNSNFDMCIDSLLIKIWGEFNN